MLVITKSKSKSVAFGRFLVLRVCDLNTSNNSAPTIILTLFKAGAQKLFRFDNEFKTR